MTNANTLTATIHSMLVLAAGDTFTWPGMKSSRPDGPVRAGLCAWIKAYSGGLCAFCGEASDNLEIGHVVSGGNGNTRYGWTPGNLGAVCRPCNEVDGAMHAVVPFESIVRPDLIPATWPARRDWKGFKEIEDAEKNAIKARKRAIRGM